MVFYSRTKRDNICMISYAKCYQAVTKMEFSFFLHGAEVVRVYYEGTFLESEK